MAVTGLEAESVRNNPAPQIPLLGGAHEIPADLWLACRQLIALIHAIDGADNAGRQEHRCDLIILARDHADRLDQMLRDA